MITMYTSDRCPYCMRAKALFDARGYEYEEIHLGMDDAGREELVARTGRYSFPQVFVGDHLIGGYDETAAADASGELAVLIAQ